MAADPSRGQNFGKPQSGAGRIDALVNNAGYTQIGSLEETTIEEAKQLFETKGRWTMNLGRLSRYATPFSRL
jgi:short-subunit dehydrogenase